MFLSLFVLGYWDFVSCLGIFNKDMMHDVLSNLAGEVLLLVMAAVC